MPDVGGTSASLPELFDAVDPAVEREAGVGGKVMDYTSGPPRAAAGWTRARGGLITGVSIRSQREEQ